MRLFLLFIITCCSTYCFSQSNEVAFIRGDNSVSPTIFSKNNIKKEVIYALNMESANKDSFMYKTRLYDSLGNITKEIYPFLGGLSNTIFYYNTHNKVIKEFSPDRPADDVENTYDLHGNLISAYKKSNSKITVGSIFKYNNKQQLIKRADLVGDSDITRTEQYFYNKNGKIDSVIIFQGAEKYTEYCQYNSDTVTVSYTTKGTTGISTSIYNAAGQLIRTVQKENTPTYSVEEIQGFTYATDGTIQQESIINDQYQESMLLSHQYTIYDHYYSQ
jgi:hypothetical protein